MKLKTRGQSCPRSFRKSVLPATRDMVNKLATIAVTMLSWLALCAPASVIVSNLNPPVAIYVGGQLADGRSHRLQW